MSFVFSQTAQSKPLHIYFSSHLMGQIEACGCTLGPPGGAKRLSSNLEKLYAENKDAKVFLDGGQHLETPFVSVSKSEELKKRQSEILGYFAKLPNGYFNLSSEDLQGGELDSELSSKFINSGMILSKAPEINSRVDLDIPGLKMAVFGYTDDPIIESLNEKLKGEYSLKPDRFHEFFENAKTPNQWGVLLSSLNRETLSEVVKNWTFKKRLLIMGEKSENSVSSYELLSPWVLLVTARSKGRELVELQLDTQNKYLSKEWLDKGKSPQMKKNGWVFKSIEVH